MSQPTVTIPKEPALTPAEDFYLLRRQGIGFIEEMASRLWTDYNSHDPGITILEALCYALTDLAYRAGWDVKDLMAPATPAPDPSQPFPDQPFFTARRILTVNPVTPDDFRRLLIDLDYVRNAWIFCKECACDLVYYAFCEHGQLRLSWLPPVDDRPRRQVFATGLYEALVELESDPDLGDLNDRKIVSRSRFQDADGVHPVTMELRFPEIEPLDREGWRLFLVSDAVFADPSDASWKLRLTRFGATREYDLFTDPGLDAAGRDAYLRRHWNGTFYASFEIELVAAGRTIVLEHAGLRLYGDNASRKASTADGIRTLLLEKGASGFVPRYREKGKLREEALRRARATLKAHRNLDEDYCRVKAVGIEEIAACADVEVRPDADIERVQAQIWFEIEKYLNPPVGFHSLPELMNAGVPVEEIFNGPELDNGFILARDLAAAGLKTVLRVSDIVNRLMEIDGVVAVNHLQLAKYDQDGNLVKGAADPTFTGEGNPVFDGGKSSASWLMYVASQHQPRLYLNASRFLFYRNGLPFLPRMDEATDTLNELRGEAERPKVKGAVKDLPIPAGTFRAPEDYFPVQYSFPLTYGTGPEGLPPHASPPRRAQARQLKAYLLVFEQILGNAFAQVAHAGDLFSLSPAVKRSYFVRLFDAALIAGYDQVVVNLTQARLEALAETRAEFNERRNRFLDHVLARFGEQFAEYALLLTDLEGNQVAQDQLIKDKIAFLKAYPALSHDRGRAFNYSVAPCAPGNAPGIKRRIELLLGLDDKRAIVVEHLLLRPKFPGDALYGVCTEGSCRTCGDEDPYSFRLTFVMPGWIAPFDADMALREFADRTIMQETPSHLLPKICWVGNDGFIAGKEDPAVAKLAGLLMEKGVTGAGTRPEREEACDCAAAIFARYNTVFKEWFSDRTLERPKPEQLKGEIEAEFAAKVLPADVSCTTVLDAGLWAEVQRAMVERFLHLALFGWQFERFEDAWCQWLKANALFDWTGEHLQERVEAMLTKSVSPSPLPPPSEGGGESAPSPGGGGQGRGTPLCRCAAAILAKVGTVFHDLIDAAFLAGKPVGEIPEFTPGEIELCPGLEFAAGTADRIRDLLKERYNAYREVSYRLRTVLELLGRLENSYPPATLHDFDAGNDQNPVRLGKTALGD